MRVPDSAARIAPTRATLAFAAALAVCSSSAAAQLREVGRAPVAGRYNVAYDVDVAAGHAFVTGNLGVNVFDVRDPTRPRRVALVAIEGGAFGVVAAGGIVYAASGGLVVADARDPSRPRILGTVPAGGSASAVAVCDGVAYLGDRNGWLSAVDVRNAARPRLISRSRVATGGHGIACARGLVYYADPQTGLRVVDVSDPATPQPLATVPGTGTAWDVQILGSRLYLGRHGSGVSVLDLSLPREPRALGTFADGGEVYGVSGDSTRLFVADLQQGVELLDVSVPFTLRVAARLSGYAPHAVRLSGAHVYVADQDKGLVILAVAPQAERAPTPASEYQALLRLHDTLPRYAGARVVFGHRQRPIVSQGEPHPPYLLHIFEARGTLADALEFYRRELTARGWRVTELSARRLRAVHGDSGLNLLLDPSFGFPDRFIERRPPEGIVRWGVSLGGTGMDFR